MIRRPLRAAVTAYALSAAASAASGQVRITEYVYESASGTSGEFVEITNVGSMPVNLSGWSIGDSSTPPGTIPLSAVPVLLGSRSVIITDQTQAVFSGNWGLSPGAHVIGGQPLNLDQVDQINLYDGMGMLVDRLDYGDSLFPGSINAAFVSGNPNRPLDAGQNNIHNWSLSEPGDGYGSIESLGGDVGNPDRFFPPPPLHKFNLRQVDFAPPNSPISSLFGFFQHPLGSDLPPHAADIQLDPSLAFDSYAAMDPIGPSTDISTADGPINLAPGPVFPTANQFTGRFLRGGGVISGQSPSGNPGVFIASLTILSSDFLSGPIATVTVSDALGTRPIELALDGGATVRGGGAEYQMRSFLRGVMPIVAQRGGGAEYAAFDIWVQRVCPGDADGNQLVDFGDVLAVLANFGAIGPAMPGSTPGDVDGNGLVSFSDVLEVLAQFGTSCP